MRIRALTRVRRNLRAPAAALAVAVLAAGVSQAREDGDGVAVFAHLTGGWLRAALRDADAFPLDYPRRRLAARMAGFEASTGLSVRDVVLPNVEYAEWIDAPGARSPWRIEVYTTDERRFERAVWEPLVRAAGRPLGGGRIVALQIPPWPTAYALREGRRIRILVAPGRRPAGPEDFDAPPLPGAAARRPSDPEASWVWWRRGLVPSPGFLADREGRARLTYGPRSHRVDFELRSEPADAPVAARTGRSLGSRLHGLDTTAVFFAGRGVTAAALDGLARVDTAQIAGLFALDLRQLAAGWVGDEMSFQILENGQPGAAGVIPGTVLTVRTTAPRVARVALGAMERELGNWDVRFESEEYRGIEMRAGALRLLPRCRLTWATLANDVVLGYHPDFVRRIIDKTVNSRIHPLLADLPDDADWIGFVDFEVLDRINVRLNEALAESDLPLAPAGLRSAVLWAKQDGPRVAGRLVFELR